MSFLDYPSMVAIIVAIPSAVLGFLAWRRSAQVDKITAQSGAASAQIGAVNQVIDGLNRLVDNLQEDNKTLRENVVYLNSRLKELALEHYALEKEVKELEAVVKSVGREREPSVL